MLNTQMRLGKMLREYQCFSLKNSNQYNQKQWCTQLFFLRGGSTNSVEDRGQRERGSGGSSPLVRGVGGRCNFVQ